MYTDPTSPAADAPAKPALTHKEMSWHVTVAGIRAKDAAEAAGCQPDARHALALAAAAQGGVATEFPIVTLGTLWAIETMDVFYEDLVGDQIGADRALMALALTQSERVLLSSLAGDREDLRLGMIEVSALSAAHYFRLKKNYDAEMERLKSLTGGGTDEDLAGKPTTASNPSQSSAEAPAAG